MRGANRHVRLAHLFFAFMLVVGSGSASAMSSCKPFPPFVTASARYPVVVHGKVTARRSAEAGGYVSTFSVVKRLKGELPINEFRLHEIVWNYIPATVGSEWILVLEPTGSGADIRRGMCSPYLPVDAGRVTGLITTEKEQSMTIQDVYAQFNVR
ncbi:MAG: hypothetical protein JNM76_02540 [Betaproteobacteria bacterium]|nr:hypothetical protein [Betaproteobacteria bacterium]